MYRWIAPLVAEHGADWRPLVEMPVTLRQEVVAYIEKRNEAIKRAEREGRRRRG